MLSIVKNAAKKLPYPLFLKIFYGWFYAVQAPRAESLRRKAGFAPLTQEDLERRKTSDTLVVLGSGPSINHITAERWQAIARCDTAGFNLWVFHPFVPRMYFIESIYRERDEATNRYLEKYNACVRARASEYDSTLKVVTGMHPRGRHSVLEWPQAWKTGFRAVCDLPVPARNESELEYLVSYQQSRGAFGPWNRLPYLFKYGSTVIAMIALGVRMGYRNIILCGIDLDVNQYFYQDAELYPETASLAYHPRAARFKLMEDIPWRIPADLAILTLKRRLLDPAGIGLFVESRSSALYPRVPEVTADLLDAPPAPGKLP